MKLENKKKTELIDMIKNLQESNKFLKDAQKTQTNAIKEWRTMFYKANLTKNILWAVIAIIICIHIVGIILAFLYNYAQ